MLPTANQHQQCLLACCSVAMATLATSAVTATCGSSICRPASSGASSTAGLRLAPGSLGAGSSWSSKTVSNGSRVNAFLTVNPNTNLKFETLSYLPPLTDDQIFKQIDYLLKKKLIPAIEFDNKAELTRTHYAGPGYYDGRYWTLWRLPLFGANDPAQVLREIQEAKNAYPEAFIRVIGFDNIRQVQSTGFIVHKPDGKL